MGGDGGVLLFGSSTLTCVSFVSVWLLRRRDRRGWLVQLWEQLLWLPYAVVTGQPSFVVSAVWFAWQSRQGWREWAAPYTAGAAGVAVDRDPVSDGSSDMSEGDAPPVPLFVEADGLMNARNSLRLRCYWAAFRCDALALGRCVEMASAGALDHAAMIVNAVCNMPVLEVLPSDVEAGDVVDWCSALVCALPLDDVDDRRKLYSAAAAGFRGLAEACTRVIRGFEEEMTAWVNEQTREANEQPSSGQMM